MANATWAQTPQMAGGCWFAHVVVGSATQNAEEITLLYRNAPEARSIRRQLLADFASHGCLHFVFENSNFSHMLDVTLVRNPHPRAGEEPYFGDISSRVRKNADQVSQACREMAPLPLARRYRCYLGTDYEMVNGFYPRANTAAQIIDAFAHDAVRVFARNEVQMRAVLETNALARVWETVAQGIRVPDSYVVLGGYVLEANGFVPNLAVPSYWESTGRQDPTALRVLRASSFLQEHDRAYTQFGAPAIVQLSSYETPTIFFGGGPRLIDGLNQAMARAGYRYRNGEWR